MHNDPEGEVVLEKFGARRFIETTDDEYESVIKYCEHIHLDLATYDYMNK
jgi:hypothetical protein